MARPPRKPPAPHDDTDKRKGGQQPHVPSPDGRKLVKICKAGGFTDRQNANTLEISLNTLKKYYAHELEIGADQVNAKVTVTMAMVASDPKHPRCVTAGIWWQKNRMGWKGEARLPEGEEDNDRGEQMPGAPGAAEVPTFTILIGGKKDGG